MVKRLLPKYANDVKEREILRILPILSNLNVFLNSKMDRKGWERQGK